MFDLIPFGRNDRTLLNFFDDFEKRFFDHPAKAFAGFKIDIVDNGDSYQLEAELPGYKKEDIRIDLDGEYLTIRAEQSEEKKDEQKNYIRQERRFGSYARSFNVSDIATEDISAEYRDGILHLTIPKKVSAKPTPKSIDIN